MTTTHSVIDLKWVFCTQFNQIQLEYLQELICEILQGLHEEMCAPLRK